MTTVETRKCTRCGQVKPVTEFYVDRRPTAGGYTFWCRKCGKIPTTEKTRRLNKPAVWRGFKMASVITKVDLEEAPPELRPYQKDGISFLSNKKRAILADVMGTGKTCQALLAARYSSCRKVLVVCPKSVEAVWVTEIRKWLGHMVPVVVVSGQPHQRLGSIDDWKQLPAGLDIQIMITHYELLKEIPKEWDCIIFDEAHRLRNRKTQRFERAKTFYSTHMFFLTGTPIVKHPSEIITYLMLLRPQEFKHYWPLVKRYFAIIQTQFGMEISAYPKDPAEFRSLVSTVLLRRDKKTALPGLPEKVRLLVPLEMHPKQEKLYVQIAKELLAELPGGRLLLVPAEIAKLVRLRQILVTPRLIGSDAPSASLSRLKELAEDAKDVEESLVVYTPFRMAVTYIQEVLKSVGVTSTHIVGGMKQWQLASNVERFQRGEVDAIVGTIAVAEGFSLARSKRVVFLGADWTPSTNEQAEDRVHRIGQEYPVTVEYFHHPDTMEDHLMAIVNGKAASAGVVLDAKKLLLGNRVLEETWNRS